MSTLFDMNYFTQNRDAMLYVKLSAGEPAFYSSFEPVPHGKDAFEMLFKCLNDAKDEIFLATWYLEPNMELLRKNWDGSISSRANYVLENLLISKAKQGVIIRGLVWNFLNLGVTEAPFDWMTPGTVTVPIEVAGKIMMRKVRELNNRLRKINRANEIVVTNHTMPFTTSAALGISFPLGGSHHQKMWVTRSNTNLTAFVGGMNLRQHDWDSQSHAILDQRRNPASMEGKERKRKETALEDPDYPPRHDWMVRMEGQAAYRILEEFKKRWAMARRKQFPTLTLDKIPTAGKLFVQKSRTYPIQFGGGERGILAAYEHAFKQAKHFVYIENQYWTSERLTKVLISQLKKNPGLYVVMLLPDKAEDPVVGKYIAGEQWFLLSQLWKTAGKSRVRAYVMYKKHPIKKDYVNVYVHSKIAIVDDLWATIGSANTNNRSMIIDTECNVQIAHRDAVKSFRKRAWKEIIGDTFGESDNAVSAIKSGWFPQGEKNKSLRQKGKELEGYIVPLSPPDEMKRVPKSIILLL